MKLNFQEEPKEWRKATLLPLLGLAVLSSLLRWRNHLPVKIWLTGLALCAVVALCAWLQPRWFRGWYRLSLRLGYYSGQYLGGVVLVIFFLFILTPLGLVLRWMGQDPLQLKRPPKVATYWHSSRTANPLDQLF